MKSLTDLIIEATEKREDRWVIEERAKANEKLREEQGDKWQTPTSTSSVTKS
jgi:hypothetical protein